MAQVIQFPSQVKRPTGDPQGGAMTMSQVIADRLMRMRKLRGLSRKELAEETKKARQPVTEQTIYRIEKERTLPHKRTIEALARALKAEPGVLSGEKPIPPDASPASAPPDEAAYQLNIRVDAAIRNAFELVARRYRVSVPKIAQLAPLLFVILAEASLRHRRKKLDEFEGALDRISELRSDLPHFTTLFMDEQEESIRAEQASIDGRDLFGLKTFDPYGVYDEEESNPFAAYLKALTASRGDIAIRALGPTSTKYRVCRAEAMELAGHNEEIAGWVLNGEVPIHQMRRGLKSVEERVKWMRDNKISVNEVPEDVPEGFPRDLEPINPADIHLLDLDSI